MKSLICFNTYKSPELVKSFIWDYINFTHDNPMYDFIVSLDGEDKETIKYCKKFSIPLLYSEENEGVGISKNRVIQSFPEYDYYFFLEDDIELLNSKVFDIHIQLSQELHIEHFSLFEACRIRNQMDVYTHREFHIIQAMYGGAPFNFFTKKGLETVGGFHTLFAKYKRFGHTEHTYRFVNNGLIKYPFQIIQECLDGYFKWNDPVSRIKVNVEVSKNWLFVEEEELIEKKLTYFPITTLSPYYILNPDNRENSHQIIYDTHTNKHKRHFYIKLGLLEFARSIKGKIKSLGVK